MQFITGYQSHQGGIDMSDIIIALSVLVSIMGVIVGAWSIIDTRKKYYFEYKERKRNAKN